MPNNITAHLKDYVRKDDIDWALRVINSQFRNPYTLPEQARALKENHWFPWLKDDPAIHALLNFIPDRHKTGTLCSPQIVLGLPHPIGAEVPKQLVPHVDEVPAKAIPGDTYLRIMCVPLTRSHVADGGLYVWRRGRPNAIVADPGDAIILHRNARHCSGINTTGNIRYAVYFRWLDYTPAWMLE